MSFVARWGLALAAPRTAMASADDPDVAGRAAGDLLRALAVVLVVAHTRALVGAAWIAWELSLGDAGPGILRAVSGASMFSLVFVVAASLVVAVAAGARRNLGRDFDLACVAALAPCTVGLVASLVAALVGLGAIGRALVLVGALGWGGALVVLAIAQARRRR